MVTFTFKKTYNAGRKFGIVVNKKIQFTSAKRAKMFQADMVAQKATIGFTISEFTQVA